jgi:hypothetical protein
MPRGEIRVGRCFKLPCFAEFAEANILINNWHKNQSTKDTHARNVKQYLCDQVVKFYTFAALFLLYRCALLVLHCIALLILRQRLMITFLSHGVQ